MMAHETMVDPVAEQRGNQDVEEEEEVSRFISILKFASLLLSQSSSPHRRPTVYYVSIVPGST